MLLEEFDRDKNAVVTADTFYDKIDSFPKTCVAIFSSEVAEHIIEMYRPKVIAKMKNASQDFLIYKLSFGGVELAFYQAPVGAPTCAMCFEIIAELGAKNLLLVGYVGCLDPSIEDYSIIIPTAALRDEGTSFHYLPASDEVDFDPKVIKILENVFKRNNINYKKGKTWTTDAMFRETPRKIKRRREQGAIVVDMECSAMLAVSKFKGLNFGQFFYAADNLGHEKYDPRSLVNDEPIAFRDKIIPLMLECGCEMDKNFNY